MPKLDLLKQVNQRTVTTDTTAVNLNIKNIPIGEIQINKNIRETSDIEIEDLKASIKQVGLLQPITVYKNNDDYICLMGHRRLLAYSQLYKENKDRFHSIRCIVTDNDKITIKQLIENIQREDLKQIELYYALKELKTQGLTLKQIADIIGKKESYIKKIFTAINDIDKNPDIKNVFNSFAGVTFDDVIDTKQIKDSKTKVKLLQDRADGKLTRAQLRGKVNKIKENLSKPNIENNKKRENNVKMLTNANILKSNKNDLSIQITVKDIETFNILISELKRINKEYNINFQKGV